MGWSGSFGTMAFHIVSLPIRRTPSKEIFRGAPSMRAQVAGPKVLAA